MRVLEAAPEVGGTWYYNRYPGARCDVESVDYCYSFSDELQQEWNWTEKYATQAEILRYLNWVADKLDLRRDVTFNSRVVSTVLDEDTLRWTVTTADGEVRTARFCLMATGPLSDALTPNFNGLDSFAGEIYHTAHWPDQQRRLQRQAGGGHRHRILWHSDDSDHRRAGRAPLRLPAHPQLQHPGGEQAVVRRGNGRHQSGLCGATPAVVAQRRRITAHHRIQTDHGVHPGGAPRRVRKALAAWWCAVLQDVPGSDDRHDGQRRGPQVLRGEDPGHHRRSGDRRPVDSQRPSHRHQANLHGQQLLSDLQQAQRVADQRAGHPDRIRRRRRNQHH